MQQNAWCPHHYCGHWPQPTYRSCIQPSTLNPQPLVSKGATTAPTNPAPVGEVSSAIGTADGDKMELARDHNSASRAKGNIAGLDHAPLIDQPSGRPTIVNITSFCARDMALWNKSKLKTHSSKHPFQNPKSPMRIWQMWKPMLWGPHVATKYLPDVWINGGRVQLKITVSNWFEIYMITAIAVIRHLLFELSLNFSQCGQSVELGLTITPTDTLLYKCCFNQFSKFKLWFRYLQGCLVEAADDNRNTQWLAGICYYVNVNNNSISLSSTLTWPIHLHHFLQGSDCISFNVNTCHVSSNIFVQSWLTIPNYCCTTPFKYAFWSVCSFSLRHWACLT